jgi:hypothetical protein
LLAVFAMTINGFAGLAPPLAHWRGHPADALECSREIIWRYEHGYNSILAAACDGDPQRLCQAMRKRIKEIERALRTPSLPSRGSPCCRRRCNVIDRRSQESGRTAARPA